MILRIGSRGSLLARWQAEHVKQHLERSQPGLSVEIRILHTTGDRVRDVPLAMIGDKGLFTKEIDRAILDGEVDAAVHSLKDVPTRLEPGLVIAAVLSREDPRDALLVAPGVPATITTLPRAARVGTSSLRRRAQLLHARPDVSVLDLRGNLDTRLRHLAGGDYDAMILACAGLRRLGQESAIAQILEPPQWLPAAGQGALAVAVREHDDDTRRLLAALDERPARLATTAERAFLRALEGGCQIPIGALARVEAGKVHVHGLVASVDGRTLIRGEAAGEADAAAEVGAGLARDLIERGAADVLRQIRGARHERLPRASAP